ncbi:MAG: hypothetical protein JXM74_08695, partial [Fusobacteriaceae bacterium]|nr:hypothetical protein [Fusobacteriaceae bacterium]
LPCQYSTPFAFNSGLVILLTSIVYSLDKGSILNTLLIFSPSLSYSSLNFLRASLAYVSASSLSFVFDLENFTSFNLVAAKFSHVLGDFPPD